MTMQDGYLKITNGYAFFRESDMKESDHPSLTVYFVDENGKKYSFPAKMKPSVNDYAFLTGSDNDLSYASFDFDADLSVLPAGNYRIYLHLKTDSDENVFEMYDMKKDNISSKTDNKSFTLVRSNVRYRRMLTIQDIK